MRLDADIRQLAEAAQTRRRVAADRVKRGEIPHLNFMSHEQIAERAQDNLAQVIEQGSIVGLADCLNYGLAMCKLDKEQATDEQ